MTDSAFPYRVTELLYKSDRLAVYRALHEPDRVPVILKVLDPRRSRPRDLEQLKHEYALGTSLDTEAVVKPLSLEIDREMPTLVLEDFGGESLSRLLGTPMPIDRFLPLAVRIAEAVAALHQREIIHKDLKPQNILVNPHPAGEAHRLRARLAPPARAPGRAAARADRGLAAVPVARADGADEPRDRQPHRSLLARRHLLRDAHRTAALRGATIRSSGCTATSPAPRRPPSELVPELPEILSAIVLKLLAKMPEDRYQTARGLQRDLERCLAQWRADGQDRAVPAGRARRLGPPPDPAEALRARATSSPRCCSAFERVVGTGAARAGAGRPATPASASPRWSRSCTSRSSASGASSCPGSSTSTSATSPTPRSSRPSGSSCSRSSPRARRRSRPGGSGCSARSGSTGSSSWT